MTDEQRLERVVLEIERHAAGAGWDQPASMYALVDTADLLQREPQLAAVLGIEHADTGLTPVEQEPVDETVQDLLATIVWPPEVDGCAVVLEARVETATDPDGEGDASEGEARVVAGALRTGEGFCAIRQRAHDEDDLVMVGTDLVPGLLELLYATLEPDAGDTPADEPTDGPTDEHLP